MIKWFVQHTQQFWPFLLYRQKTRQNTFASWRHAAFPPFDARLQKGSCFDVCRQRAGASALSLQSTHFWSCKREKEGHEDTSTKDYAASNVFLSRTQDCSIWPTYHLQEELDASVATGDRHGNVSMRWRSTTPTETSGGMALWCLLPSSPYGQTPPAQAPWKGSCTSAGDFAEQVLKWAWCSLHSRNPFHCTQTWPDGRAALSGGTGVPWNHRAAAALWTASS